jgi:AAA+ superfamily predicted ATPase
MDGSHFKVKSVIDMKSAKDGQKIPESDFSLFTSDDKFIQFDYVDEGATETYPVKAGIWHIAVDESRQFCLKPSSFVSEPMLEEYTHTKDISSKINAFFSKKAAYEKYGVFPKRGILLYGAPGCGKSATISKLCREYDGRHDTAVILWHTDKYEASDVKSFVKRFEYQKSVDKFILVIEDVGGVEYQGSNKMPSNSSLLSLLDNVERTFTIPTMILATTNYPENMLENLTNRPQRFDDVISVKPPSADFRERFLQFFSQNAADEKIRSRIRDKKYIKLSIAHIKEIVIRSAIYDLDLNEALDQIYEQATKAQKDFSERSALGMGMVSEDY